MLCPRVSSRGLVFLVSLVFLVFFELFWFLDLEAFIGYRAEKKNKNIKENQKKQSLGRNVVPKGFLQGIGFFGFFVFFGFLWVFLFLDSEAFIGYRAEKKNKKIKENQKNKETKKNKVLGEMLCPRVSSRGLVFWVSLVSLAFFGFLRVFIGFWFMNVWGICPT